MQLDRIFRFSRHFVKVTLCHWRCYIEVVDSSIIDGDSAGSPPRRSRAAVSYSFELVAGPGRRRGGRAETYSMHMKFNAVSHIGQSTFS